MISKHYASRDSKQADLVVADALRGRSSVFWSVRRFGLWPHDAQGNTLLGYAILAVGRALFADWTGDEPLEMMRPVLDGSRAYVADGFDAIFASELLAQSDPERAKRFSRDWFPLKDPLHDKDWRDAETLYAEHMVPRRAVAFHRMISVQNVLWEALANDGLASFVRTLDGFKALPSDWWINEEINARRFRECQTDPDNPHIVHTPHLFSVFFDDPSRLLYPGNAWIFVSRESLTALVSNISKSKPSDAAARRAPSAFSQGAAERACAEFEKAHPDAGREQWVEAAQLKFGMSVRAARKIWKDNEPPEGRKTGPKKTRS